MAPTLSSNSFLLSTTPHSRLSLKAPKLTVFAKRAGPFSPFPLGKPKNDSEGSQTDGPVNSTPFKFDFSKVKSLVPVVSSPASGISFGNPRRKDSGTVFVAGANGQAGVRISQTLLRQGFSVRAGVSELGAAQELALLAAKYNIISKEESKRLNAVESTFQDAESIAKAIGNASKVVVTIGPAEDGPSTEVSTSDALQVIKAAQLAGVNHVAIVYDGNAAGQSTYNVLDGITSFFNNLLSPSQPLSIPEFLQKLIETDVNYTFIKTSLTEDFSPESSYNLVVSTEGSTHQNDFKVAKSQIASLVADVFCNTAVAENKVVEVYSDPSAPSKSVGELFRAVPEDERRKVYAATVAKEKAEEEARIAAEEAREAAQAAKKLQEESKASGLADEAQKKAEATGASVENLLSRAKDIGSGFSWEKLSSQITTAAQRSNDDAEPKVQIAQKKAEATGASVENLLSRAKDIGSGFSWEKLGSQITTVAQRSNDDAEPKVQIATVRGQAKARSLAAQKAVTKRSIPKLSFKSKEQLKPKPKETESKAEVRKLFGGLFQQETIYIEDD